MSWEPSGKDLSNWAKWRDQKKKRKQAAAAGGNAADEDRFASKYYAGTFDEELNKLAVDTTTLWQGYYPSLYNPHTQEAAAHLPAPTQQQIDPLTGEIIAPPPPPEPAPPTAAPRIKYGKGKARRRGDDWFPGIYGYPKPGNNPSRLATAGIAAANAATGAPRPEVNPLGELVPWQYSNWVISMGQWRGA